MKYSELSFKRLVQATVHGWKWILGIILAFTVVGVICGFLFSKQVSAEGSGYAEAFEHVDFQPLDQKLNYYTQYYSYLLQQQKHLLAYVQNVQADHTIDDAQNERLTEVTMLLNEFDITVIDPIAVRLSEPDAFFLPDSLREDAIREYTGLLETTKDNITRSEYALTILQSIGGLNTSDAAINETYAEILNEASQYAQRQLDLQNYTEKLKLLQEDYITLRANSQEMERQLDDATDQINQLVEQTNALLSEIAQTNHLEITFSINADETSLTALIAHTNRLATQEEAFAAFVVFFVLAGICVGMFAALCKELRIHKEEISVMMHEEGEEHKA